MPVFRLPENELIFPDPNLAEEGLLAVGGDLSPDRLILAYNSGIFPWYNPGEPILWWSPDPRFVLYPEELKVSKSMRPYFNNSKFNLSFDRAFEEVMLACSRAKRKGQEGGTWITEDMLSGYCRLHELGFAHSVEVWQDDALVGGLYGVALGKVFFGESMFASVSNASKFGFISLVRQLKELDFWLIDCQQETRHLKSLGARGIGREMFLHLLGKNLAEESQVGNWSDFCQG